MIESDFIMSRPLSKQEKEKIEKLLKIKKNKVKKEKNLTISNSNITSSFFLKLFEKRNTK